MKIVLLALIMTVCLGVSGQVYNVKTLGTLNVKTGETRFNDVENVKVIIYHGMFMCANHQDDCMYFFSDSLIKLPTTKEPLTYKGKTYMHTDASLEIRVYNDLYKCKITTFKGSSYFFLSGIDTLLTKGVYLKETINWSIF